MTTTFSETPVLAVSGLTVEGQQGFLLDIPAFVIERPALVTIIGRNGSGKSTFLEAVLDLIAPRTGEIRLFGHELRLLPARHPVRDAIGAQVQGVSWPWSIKVQEIMSLHQAIYGRNDAAALAALGVPKLLPTMYRKLSTGQKRRVDLGVALAHVPSLLVLDEPTTGLDRQYQDAYGRLMTERKAETTVLIASHDPRDVEAADRVVWLENGRIVEDDAPGALLKRMVGDHVCTLEDAAPATLDVVETRIAPVAISCRREARAITLTGGDAMRSTFLTEIERLSQPSFSVRAARAGDLLDLLKHDAREEIG